MFSTYNIGFYIPKKDTCATCDKLDAKLKSGVQDPEAKNIKEVLASHHQEASQARHELKKAEMLCRDPKSKLLCFTFDLQKTQPIPYINTSVAFYKRRLWLYNLGINDRKNNKGHMFVWEESEGKRGSNEIGSAILEYLNTLDLTEFDEIHNL